MVKLGLSAITISPNRLARFWSKVEISGNCWEWKAAKSNGYGNFGVINNKYMRAHRFAYELLEGPIPETLEIDRLCRNRACVNPAHMDIVTSKENTLRGIGISAQESRQTHCKHGHEFTPENTYIDNGSKRICRICHRERSRKWRATLP